jgi:hypothetical protein
VAFQPAGDFEFQQHRAHDRRRGARQPHQIVDRYRRRTQQADDARALVVVRLDVQRAGNVTLGLLHWQIEAAAEDRFQHRDHVGRMRAGAEAPPRRASAGRASSGARRHNH